MPEYSTIENAPFWQMFFGTFWAYLNIAILVLLIIFLARFIWKRLRPK